MDKKKKKPPNETIINIMKKFEGNPGRTFTGMGFLNKEKESKTPKGKETEKC